MADYNSHHRSHRDHVEEVPRRRDLLIIIAFVVFIIAKKVLKEDKVTKK